MKTLIRVIQAVLILEAVNGAYGLAAFVGLSALSGTANRRNLFGAVATILICGLGVYLLQKYLETKSSTVATITPGKFLGMSVFALAAAALTGLAIVVLLVLSALTLA